MNKTSKLARMKTVHSFCLPAVACVAKLLNLFGTCETLAEADQEAAKSKKNFNKAVAAAAKGKAAEAQRGELICEAKRNQPSTWFQRLITDMSGSVTRS